VFGRGAEPSVLAAWAALLLALSGLARAEPVHRDPPGERLSERAEGHISGYEAALRRQSLEHYALIGPVDPADLLRWIAPISPYPDGDGFVLAVGTTPELHGGALLDFLFRHWRPEGRAARPEDRFPFPHESVALGTIYAGHRRQIFLPVPGRPAEAIRGALPDPPALARMLFFAETESVQVVERDAYSFLRLLVAREDDFAASWKNEVGQELSVDLLLQHAWRHYLQERSAESERADHSNLHLVEVLLAYHHRGAEGPGSSRGLDPNAIKRRYMTRELARPDSETDDEGLAHYAESLGWLLADPHVTWNADERAQVNAWLEQLEKERFADLAAFEEGAELTHLVKGLRLLRTHRSRLGAP
jgi:hypothetical protein